MAAVPAREGGYARTERTQCSDLLRGIIGLGLLDPGCPVVRWQIRHFRRGGGTRSPVIRSLRLLRPVRLVGLRWLVGLLLVGLLWLVGLRRAVRALTAVPILGRRARLHDAGENSTHPTAREACRNDVTRTRIRPTPASTVSTRPISSISSDTNPATERPATTASLADCLGNMPNAATKAAATSSSVRP